MLSWLQQLAANWTRLSSSNVRHKPKITCRLQIEELEDRCVPTVFTVTNTLDTLTAGTFRTAIVAVDAGAGGDTIAFNIPGTGIHNIVLSSALPMITKSVTIDGTTQPGFGGAPLVEIDGSKLPAGTDGLVLGTGSDASTINSIIAQHFYFGLHIESGASKINNSWFNNNAGGVYIDGGTSGAAGNLITGNLIASNTAQGLIIGGGAAAANIATGNYILNSGGDGVYVFNGATGNSIGTGLNKFNVISSNGSNGIHLIGNSATGNTVAGNYIGTDSTGMSAAANGADGVLIDSSGNNIIGYNNTLPVTPANARNIISGNSQSGVEIIGAPSTKNQILSNYIGTNATGSAALANGTNTHGNLTAGVSISQSAINNFVGGNANGFIDRNIISGNAQWGVLISGLGVTTNTVEGNFIGTDATGQKAVGNFYDGVLLYNGPTNNTIGALSVFGASGAAYAQNVISGNGRDGINIYGTAAINTTNNNVQGNFIGLNFNGSVAIPNGSNPALGLGSGVEIQGGGARNNTIGSIVNQASPFSNVISGQTNTFGVNIHDSGTTGNIVEGNFIGTSAGGTLALANNTGVYLHGQATGNIIGGTVPGTGNAIAGNVYGVILFDAGTTANVVEGNQIGTNSSFNSFNIGNTVDGVRIDLGAAGNTIGGVSNGTGNVISGNGSNGITISGATVTNTLVQGNYIGTTLNGNGVLGNVNAGIALTNGTNNNIIGGSQPASNTISGNGIGIDITGAGTILNTVQSNFIGTNAPGNDQQTLSVLGSPTGGSFTISLNGGMAVIPFNATATLVRTALEGIVGVGNVTASGGPFTGNPIVVTFLGAYANLPLNTMVVFANNLTGGTSASPLIVHSHVGGLANASVRNGNGIVIEQGASSNTIGGTTAGQNNVISGNTNIGVLIQGAGTVNNLVQGNEIGTDSTGAAPLQNGTNGVVIQGGAQSNLIGGSGHNSSNVIAGNGQSGVLIQGAGTSFNTIAGDFIGNSAPSNDVQTLFGSNLSGGSFTLTFGSQTTGTIPYNASATTIVTALSALSNVGANNVAAAGGPINAGPVIITFQGDLQAQPVPFLAANSTGLTGGGTVRVSHTTTGTQNVAVANQQSGVYIQGGATSNTIGGNITIGSRNIISGNIGAGVTISGAGTNSNVVEGDLIGSNAAVNDVQTITIFGSPSSGSYQLTNNGGATTTGSIQSNSTAAFVASQVATLLGVSNNDVLGEGGPGPNSPITLTFQGVLANVPQTLLTTTNVTLTGGSSPASVVVSHTVLGHAATAALANLDGVVVLNGAVNNTIGGTTATLTNLISGNNRDGVIISGTGTSSNLVQRNLIGTLLNGFTALGNLSHGVFVTDNASNNTIGGLTGQPASVSSTFPVGTQPPLEGTAAANTIANNKGNGILIGTDPGAGFVNTAGTGNQITGGNIIYKSGILGVNLGPNNKFGEYPDTQGHIGPNSYQNSLFIETGPDGSRSVQQVLDSGGNIVGLQVHATLLANPNTLYRIEFYYDSRSPIDYSSPSNYGEGKQLLFLQPTGGGSYFINPFTYAINVQTDMFGNANIDTNNYWGNLGLMKLGDEVSALVTNLSTLDTSEFSFNSPVHA